MVVVTGSNNGTSMFFSGSFGQPQRQMSNTKYFANTKVNSYVTGVLSVEERHIGFDLSSGISSSIEFVTATPVPIFRGRVGSDYVVQNGTPPGSATNITIIGYV